ncbi:MAG: DUF4337 family protein [Verrucomicrobia bacterium]|nr:DUF4337 family protein [Verrucomicrobiota bacterium]
MSETKDAAGRETGSRFELLCGVTIAILAALLAINELGSGKFGGDEIAARNEATKGYSWYGSKSLKENLAEGQRDLLLALRAAGAIAPEKTSAVQGTLDRLEGEIDRYSREKQEILMGSEAVGKENWTQAVDGQLGKVRGAKQWDSESDRLDRAGDIFDTATLFLQLCLVLGAISLIMKAPGRRNAFFTAMLILGAAGIGFSARAFSIAFNL